MSIDQQSTRINDNYIAYSPPYEDYNPTENFPYTRNDIMRIVRGEFLGAKGNIVGQYDSTRIAFFVLEVPETVHVESVEGWVLERLLSVKKVNLRLAKEMNNEIDQSPPAKALDQSIVSSYTSADRMKIVRGNFLSTIGNIIGFYDANTVRFYVLESPELPRGTCLSVHIGSLKLVRKGLKPAEFLAYE